MRAMAVDETPRAKATPMGVGAQAIAAMLGFRIVRTVVGIVRTPWGSYLRQLDPMRPSDSAIVGVKPASTSLRLKA